MKGVRSQTILFAEDDPDDRLLLQEAMRTMSSECDFRFVHDGNELIEYLRHRGRYEGAIDSPQPALIMLDLNMPGKDGRDAAQEIKSDPELRHIPIVVLTTSKLEEDVIRLYDIGVNSFVRKPATFEGLLRLVRKVREFWLRTAELPVPRSHG
jgi:two-component system response regulator